MRGKKEEIERNKTPQPIGRNGGRIEKSEVKGGGKTAARRDRLEVGDDPDRWAPPVGG